MIVRSLQRAAGWGLCLSVALICTVLTNPALADETDAYNPDALFREGKRRLAELDYGRACAMFAESFRLDPATGTLLALAICHERQGKLASAFREYEIVVARCKGEGRPDREQAARDKVTALQQQLSTLTIKTAEGQEVAGLEVRINGALIAPVDLARPLAVDGGIHAIEVAAPGKQTWHGSVSVPAHAAAKTVVIPPLDDVVAVPVVTVAVAPLPRPAVAPTRRTVDTAHTAERTGSSGLSGAQWVGIGTMGLGVAAFGTGTGFALRALSKNRESSSGCDGDVCTASGRQDRLAARAAGNAASVAFVVGGALATVGLVIYVAGAHAASSGTGTERALSIAPFTDAHGAGASMHGSF
jgi:hypothetical protein